MERLRCLTCRTRIGTFSSRGASLVRRRIRQSIWSGGQALFSILSLFVVTPVVAFYMLLDWDHMVAKVDSWVPRATVSTVRGLARDINARDRRLRARAGAGLPHPRHLVCGRADADGPELRHPHRPVCGLLSFIPYVGSLTGLVLSVGVAFVQFWPDWMMIAAVLAVFFTGQFIEGNILSPKLVGEASGLHPVWLMFALFAFGSLFGFVGLLLAVPLAATAGRAGALRRCGNIWQARSTLEARVAARSRKRWLRGWPRHPGIRANSRSTCPWSRAWARRTFSSAPPTKPPTRPWRAGLIGPTPSCCWSARPAPARRTAPLSGRPESHAWPLQRSELRQENVPHLVSGGALVIEDCDRARGHEDALFHLLNPPASAAASCC